VTERKKLDRRISADEVAVIREALNVAATPTERTALAKQLDGLWVVSACTCGCASVDFVALNEERKSTPVADAMAETARGGTVGIIVWGTSQQITGLEIYDLGAGPDDLRLPVLASIRRWYAGRERRQSSWNRPQVRGFYCAVAP